MNLDPHLDRGDLFIEVVLVRDSEVNLLIFKDPCPQCGYLHTHSGGQPGGPILDGHRIAHCPSWNSRGRLLHRSSVRDYVLVWRGLDWTGRQTNRRHTRWL